MLFALLGSRALHADALMGAPGSHLYAAGLAHPLEPRVSNLSARGGVGPADHFSRFFLGRGLAIPNHAPSLAHSRGRTLRASLRLPAPLRTYGMPGVTGPSPLQKRERLDAARAGLYVLFSALITRMRRRH